MDSVVNFDLFEELGSSSGFRVSKKLKTTISVVMPVFNSELYVQDAIQSVLNQTFRDFELIVIDDASTDQSLHVIRSFTDPRIRVITKKKNTGYTDSLNYGIYIANGRYIARMDSDDISLPNRFALQVSFMDNHRDVVLLGGAYKFIGTQTVVSFPEDHPKLLAALVEYCPFAHPTVILRTDFLRSNKLYYNRDMEPAEDYDLWARIAFLGKIHNLESVILHYRKHDKQVTVTGAKLQNYNSKFVRSFLIRQVDPNLPTPIATLDINVIAREGNLTRHRKELLNMLRACQRLVKLNSQKRIYDPDIFKDFLTRQSRYLVGVYLNYCFKHSRLSVLALIPHFQLFYRLVNFSRVFRYFFR